MAVHKDQDARDVGLLSVGRLGLGRDWTATGQLVGNSAGGRHHYAYHVSTDWRNQSGLNGCRGRRDPRRIPARRDRSGRRGVPPRQGCPHLRRHLLGGQHAERPPASPPGVRQTEETGRLRQRYAQAEGSLRAGRFDFLARAPRRPTAGSRTPLGHPIDRSQPRIHFDMGFRRRLPWSSCATRTEPGPPSPGSPISSECSDRQASGMATRERSGPRRRIGRPGDASLESRTARRT